jgi:hypothetical protein
VKLRNSVDPTPVKPQALAASLRPQSDGFMFGGFAAIRDP